MLEKSQFWTLLRLSVYPFGSHVRAFAPAICLTMLPLEIASHGNSAELSEFSVTIFSNEFKKGKHLRPHFPNEREQYADTWAVIYQF